MIDQHPTPTGTPIGYAVIEEREGEYAPPRPGDVFLVGDDEPVTGRPLTDDDARFYAGARATSHEHAAWELAQSRNSRDIEISDVVTWHVVALVPVSAPDVS